ncbi:MAG: molybdenum ABC transporter ATP-binding protein [Mangrovicoccus sp.]|nr:molybdenum ABC transporter ATP-binding protein [Mangrovicoccus sp.]
MSLTVALNHAFAGFTLSARFDAPPGITALFGRSGSGKSTILKSVAGLLRPDHGQIRLNDHLLFDSARAHCLPPHRRRLGVIFQEDRLFPHLSVGQNLRYGAWITGQGMERQARAQIIEMLGLGPLLRRRPGGLSGGERQRVAIGRALLGQPEMILADEPLSALDEARKAEILPYFERLRDELHIPILYVSHAPAEIARLATTVVALQDGQVLRQGPAREVLADPSVTPAGVRAAGAVLQAVLTGHDPQDGLSLLDAQGLRLFVPRVRAAPGTPIRLRIPAQDVMLSLSAPEGISAHNIVPARVQQIRPGEGPGALVTLETQAGVLLARVTRRAVRKLDLREGMQVYGIVKAISLAPEDVGAPKASRSGL